MPKNATTKNNVQLQHKVKTTSYISLPFEMVEDIKSLNLSKINTAYCYKFVGIIMRNNWINDNDIFDYTEIPSAYIQEAFNGKLYTSWLYPLLESGIIERDDYYNNDIKEGLIKCYNYKLNYKYFINLSNILCIDNMCKPLLSLGYSDITKINSKDIQYLNWFKNDMLSLNIDQKKLHQIVEDKISSIQPSEFLINEMILEKNVSLVYNGKTYYMNREKAIDKAKEQNKDLIKDGRRYVIDSLEAFLVKKKQSIRVSYTNAILALEMKDYRASRNTTNNRLDTNITNLCSDLTDKICEENNLVQIDLANSQFALLSHLLTDKLDTPDFRLFKRLSVSGELYDYIKDNIGLEKRKQGKLAAFEVLFSSRNNNTPNKKKLKELFPSVIKWIDDYKKENGDASFSVMLQKFESKLFIDTVLTKIKKKKIFCLTKHDSFIVRQENQIEVQSIIDAEFKKIGLEYLLDVKEPKVIEEDMIAPPLDEKQLSFIAKHSKTKFDNDVEDIQESKEVKPMTAVELMRSLGFH